MVKVPSPSLTFLLTAVYASPNFTKRKFFWEYLQNLAIAVSLPWVLLGDFNDMLSNDEKMGGLPVNRYRMTAFRNCMDRCCLMDLGFHGPRFTWTTKSPIWQNNIKERLDRGLGNTDWKLLFPAAEIHHLPRVKSDHCPIMLITNPLAPKSSKPFRFKQMWLTDPTFLPLVKDSWQAFETLPFASYPLSRFPRRLNFLINNVRTWNTTHFGKLFQRKTRILAWIRGLQLTLTRNPSAFLYSLEQHLAQEYNIILHQEYLYWQLKSRILWLNYGDANTKYFHLKTIQRWSHLRVTTLKDDTRLWLTGEPLTQHINNAFKKLYQAKSPHMRPSPRSTRQDSQCSPFPTHAHSLACIPSPTEILRNLRELPPLKAPRPDGYHELFFQQKWSTLGPSIIQVI